MSRRTTQRSQRRRRSALALVASLFLLPQGGAASVASDPGVQFPRAAQIRLRFATEIEPQAGARAARIYDHVRAGLLAQGYEPRVVIGILSAASADGLSAFVDPRRVVEEDVRLPRPSIAEELCDARRLSAFGTTLRRELGTGRSRPDVAIEGQSVTLQDVVGVFPGLMTSFYGVARNRKGSCSGRPFRRATAPRWHGPIRIGSTGDPEVDAAVRAALVRLRREVPGVPIDESSLGAANSATNFWLGDPKVPQRSVFFDGLNSCAGQALCSLQEIASVAGSTGRASRASFPLADLYLSRPYDRETGRSISIVRVDAQNRIVGAACGSSDYGVGQAPAPAGGQAFHAEFVILCLAQGLGALPGALSDAARKGQDVTLQREISMSLDQLRIIYQNN